MTELAVLLKNGQDVPVKRRGSMGNLGTFGMAEYNNR